MGAGSRILHTAACRAHRARHVIDQSEPCDSHFRLSVVVAANVSVGARAVGAACLVLASGLDFILPIGLYPVGGEASNGLL